jgi:hypothetical protein
MALVGKQTIPTERLPLVAKLVPTFADKGYRLVIAADPYGLHWVSARAFLMQTSISDTMKTYINFLLNEHKKNYKIHICLSFGPTFKMLKFF